MEAAMLPEGMVVYYLGLLKKGPTWTAEETPDVLDLQDRHLAHIRRCAELGKMVLAGPFLDNGELRGVFLFKTASLEEAIGLANADPAVEAGRLIVEIHPWMVQKGILP